MEFKYYVILACSVLAVFLIIKEINRKNKSELMWRLVASLFMVVSFALLIIPITYSIKKEEPIHELNLITEGANAATLSKINAQKYTLDSGMLSPKKGSSIKYIEDLAYHLQENKEIKKVNIYGYGLAAADLPLLKNQQVSFHAAPSPVGIISASWQKKIKATESLVVQGIYNNPTGQKIKLKLFGMGAVLDSALLQTNAKTKFSFRTQPKQFGKAIFQLIALQGNDTISVEPVPFEVAAKQQLKVLILASFPDFEYKFLKKWMYENQFPIIFRSQISKDKYSTDFLNTKSINVNRINISMLKQMDVLVIDEDEFRAITPAERSVIDAAVSDGMGLLVRLTNAKPTGPSERFKRTELTSTSKTLQLTNVEDDVKLSELPFAQTLFLQPTNNQQPLFKTIDSKTLVNTEIKGMGKVLVSSVASTYQWELAGKKSAYAKFWSTLLSKAARKEIADQSFELVPKYLSVGEKARLIANVADAKIPSLFFNQIKLAPRQNMELPYQWDAVFWPTIAGWNTVTINQKPQNIFVYKKTDWQSLKNMQKLISTSSFVSSQSKVDFNSAKIELVVEEELSKWWFFGLFLVSVSFLWYEQRFLFNK